MEQKEQREKIYLSSPTMHGEEQKFVAEAFDTNWVAPLGPNVNNFEKEMAEYTGCGYAAALSAGTAAIHLALRLIGIQPGDIVFSSDLTSVSYTHLCGKIDGKSSAGPSGKPAFCRPSSAAACFCAVYGLSLIHIYDEFFAGYPCEEGDFRIYGSFLYPVCRGNGVFGGRFHG